MRALLLLLLALGTGGAASAQTDAEAVRDAFARFQGALSARDGDAAVAAVSEATAAHYGRVLALALDADSTALAALPLSERVEVLILRRRVPAGDLRMLTGAGVFSYVVRKGWLPAAAYAAFGIGEVEVAGDVAIGAVLRDGVPVGSWFRFVRGRGGWRYDLVAAAEDFARLLRQAVGEDGEDPDALADTIVERATGAPVSDALWHPVGRD